MGEERILDISLPLFCRVENIEYQKCRLFPQWSDQGFFSFLLARHFLVLTRSNYFNIPELRMVRVESLVFPVSSLSRVWSLRTKLPSLESFILGADLASSESNCLLKDEFHNDWDSPGGREKQLRVVGMMSGESGMVCVMSENKADVPSWAQLLDSREHFCFAYFQYSLLF